MFLPTDQAFRELVTDFTGSWVRSEADVFAAAAPLGTETVTNYAARVLAKICQARMTSPQA